MLGQVHQHIIVRRLKILKLRLRAHREDLILNSNQLARMTRIRDSQPTQAVSYLVDFSIFRSNELDF